MSFASRWLAPRLHRLKERCPQLDVHLDVTDINVDLRDGQVDAAIRYGSGHYPHAAAEQVLEETVTPVCSPAYRALAGGLAAPVDLLGCTLLHEDRMLADWAQWLARAGVERSHRARQGPAYSHGSMAVEAAIRGEGVALGRSSLVSDDLAAGRLGAPFPDVRLQAERGYDLVYRVGAGNDPKIAVLRAWLAQEIRLFLETRFKADKHS
ncbi:LysR substrate-binding domain-containing protein [Azohydromonas lata]|uniref:LysR substrate-binding domain-containing protein n=1 Tax=Azohydromonas lata TaxID=45677 RepID=A0ABU5IH73_9BURK|nr:LysR substrate-binding domain-containing protein [Azohydromonas lata]MDZ5458489.1 LysR substrate-binding domain-containing protein [Azohydromonas lata]